MAIFTTTGRHIKAKQFYDNCFANNKIDLWFSIGCNRASENDNNGWLVKHKDTYGNLVPGPAGWAGGTWPYSNTNPPPPSVYPTSSYPNIGFNFAEIGDASDDGRQDPRQPSDVSYPGLPGVIGYRRVSGVSFCRPYTSADVGENLNIIYYLNSYYVELSVEQAASQNANLICLQLALDPGDLSDSNLDIIQIGLYKGLVKKSDSTTPEHIALPSDFSTSTPGATAGTPGNLILVENTIPHKRVAYNRDVRLVMLQF